MSFGDNVIFKWITCRLFPIISRRPSVVGVTKNSLQNKTDNNPDKILKILPIINNITKKSIYNWYIKIKHYTIIISIISNADDYKFQIHLEIQLIIIITKALTEDRSVFKQTRKRHVMGNERYGQYCFIIIIPSCIVVKGRILSLISNLKHKYMEYLIVLCRNLFSNPSQQDIDTILVMIPMQ